MEEILLSIEPKETRYAHLKNGQLHDLIIERKKTDQLTGNIYRGKVDNILHNIQSAFIDINEQENGFIHISDILENRQKLRELYDIDFATDPQGNGKNGSQEHEIANLLKVDQPVLVQVVKEPTGNKGARLTARLSLPGRYLVLLPNTQQRGISCKIEHPEPREHLKRFLQTLDIPQEMGLICRTASSNVPTEILLQEAHDLVRTWREVMDNFQKADHPALLFQESDLIRKAVTLVMDKNFHRLMTDDYATYQLCKRLYTGYRQQNATPKIELYRDKIPMLERFNVEREIKRALQRKIWLPSGGYLFFDYTEAMHTIDVNSGRSSHDSAIHDVEEVLIRINLEAADEIARQLRLRNIGGLIICDFIDMQLRRNKKRLLDRFKEAMKEDSAKFTILGMNEFGLVELTRQRCRKSLNEVMLSTCPYCMGRGRIQNLETIAIAIERALRKLICQQQQFGLQLICHPEIDHYLEIEDKQHLLEVAENLNAQLKFASKDVLHLTDFEFYSTINGQRLEF